MKETFRNLFLFLTLLSSLMAFLASIALQIYLWDKADIQFVYFYVIWGINSVALAFIYRSLRL